MTQLHTINHGFGIVRPTNDVDIVLHIETTRGVPSQTVEALRSIGYDLRDSFDPRDTPPTGSSEAPMSSTWSPVGPAQTETKT